jgi:hypothetical protein
MNGLVWRIGEMIVTGEKRKYSEKNQFQCHFPHHKSQIACPAIGPFYPPIEAGV